MPAVAIIPQIADVPALTGIVDGFLNAQHALNVMTGGAPIESGAFVSDHAVKRQDKLTLEGEVSTLTAGTAGPATAWSTLRQLAGSLALHSVHTEWGTYNNMLLRDAEAGYRGRGMRFTLEFEEQILVGVAEVTTPVSTGPAALRTPTVERGLLFLSDPGF